MFSPSLEATQEHPSLLFSATDLPAIQARFSEPRHQPVRDKILAEAEKYLTYTGEDRFESDPATFSSRAYKTWAQKRGPARKAFLWAYILTGDTKYSDALMDMYRHEWVNRAALNQSDFRFEFTTKDDGVMAALTYDVLWPRLSEEDRAAFGQYIDQYLVFMPKPSFGWNNNIGTGYFSAVGLIALARLHEKQEAMAILRESIERLKAHAYPYSFLAHPDGGYPEGALYLDYAMLNLLPFIHAYERTTGDKNHGLLDPEFFQNTSRFFTTMLGGDGEWISFYDSQAQDYGAAWMTYLGQRLENPLLRWGGDYIYDRILADPNPKKRSEANRSQIPHLLYRDQRPTPEFPGLPTLSVLPSVNTGSMRSESAVRPELMVSVRGYGEKETNMRAQHKDVGSFVLYAGGESLLIDPGYYQPEAEAHSALEIDGVPLQKRAASPLLAAEKGDLRALSIDPTKAYEGPKKKVPSVQRTWVMEATRAVILVDEIGESVPVRTRFQAAYKTSISPGGTAALVEGKQRRLWIGAFGPEVKLGVEGPLDFGKSWVFKAREEAGLLSWHRLVADYQANPSNPMVWVMVPLGADATLPQVKVERGEDAFTVQVGGGQAVKFVRENNRWVPADLPLQPAGSLAAARE